MLFDDIERFGNRPAIKRAGCPDVSFTMLAELSDAIAGDVGTGRRLVFVEAANTLESVAAYIGCMRGRHVVYLFDHRRVEQLAALVNIYRPDVLLYADGRVDRPSGESPVKNIHPELAVMISTSGSAGAPKLVKLSFANIDSNAKAIASYLEIVPRDCAVMLPSFAYSYGMSIVNSNIIHGASLLLTDSSPLSRQFWSLFRSSGAASFAGVPVLFEALARSASMLRELPTLRYVTQAGGQLRPELVRFFACLAREGGWKFFVMYGQTEAAPRMAFLPPELAERFPEAVGQPIPGGQLIVVDEKGAAISRPGVVGELVYMGPNVMMGYSQSASDLGFDEELQALKTGDLGRINRVGLIEVTGRLSRIAKIFGFRIDLDGVERDLRVAGYTVACIEVSDTIAVFYEDGAPLVRESVVLEILRGHNVPRSRVKLSRLSELPRLASGKIDYMKLTIRASLLV